MSRAKRGSQDMHTLLVYCHFRQSLKLTKISLLIPHWQNPQKLRKYWLWFTLSILTGKIHLFFSHFFLWRENSAAASYYLVQVLDVFYLLLQVRNMFFDRHKPLREIGKAFCVSIFLCQSLKGTIWKNSTTAKKKKKKHTQNLKMNQSIKGNIST